MQWGHIASQVRDETGIYKATRSDPRVFTVRLENLLYKDHFLAVMHGIQEWMHVPPTPTKSWDNVYKGPDSE